MNNRKKKATIFLGVALFLMLILFAMLSVFHLSKKEKYIQDISKAVDNTEEYPLEELNKELINALPDEALSVDTDWYEGVINEKLGYRKSYKKMLDMIIGSAEGIPGFSLPTYISATPLVHVRFLNPNGDFYAVADDRNVTAYLLDANRQIVGFIELSCSHFGKVMPTLLGSGAGTIAAEKLEEYPDEKYIYIYNRINSWLLNSKDKVYVVGQDVPRIEPGCYEALYSEDLAISYNDICNNALPINWQSINGFE